MSEGPWIVRIAGEKTCNSAHSRAEVDQLVDVLTSTGHGAEVLASVDGRVTVTETHEPKENDR